MRWLAAFYRSGGGAVVGECNATYKAITWERATHKRCSERQVAQCRLELGAALEREVSNMHAAQAEKHKRLIAAGRLLGRRRARVLGVARVEPALIIAMLIAILTSLSPSLPSPLWSKCAAHTLLEFFTRACQDLLREHI